MNKATTNSMNLHLQKGGRTASFQMPSEMERLIKEVTEKKRMKFSGYVKYAINNQIQRDLVDPNNNK